MIFDICFECQKKIYGKFPDIKKGEARRYILYALAESLDGNSSLLDKEKNLGDYKVTDIVNLAREFVGANIEKYGDKALDKILDTVLAKNFNLAN